MGQKMKKKIILAGIFILTIIAFTYFISGNNANNSSFVKTKTAVVSQSVNTEKETEEVLGFDEKIQNSDIGTSSKEADKAEAVLDEKSYDELNETNKDIDSDELTCTLTVRCDGVLENIERLKSEKIDIIPSDGIIFPKTTVIFKSGESVFDILKREMKKSGVHLDFNKTPAYNSVYIKGIANLYEFDMGELSGWQYKVNNKFPKCGCSQYLLSCGDDVEFIYSCDFTKEK